MDDRENQQPQVIPEEPALPMEVEPSTEYPSIPQTNTPSFTPPVAPPPVVTGGVEPNVAPMSPFQTLAPKNKKKKAFIIGGIIAAALVILGGGAALAYNFWYQNPQKVVADSIINAINAKSVIYTGSVVVSGDQKMKIEVSGNNSLTANDFTAKMTFDLAGKTYTLSAAAVYDTKGDLYVQVKDLDALVADFKSQLPLKTQTVVTKIVAEVNNQWIKISASDLTSYSKNYSEVQTCTNDAMKKIQSDNTLTAEIGDIYKKNQFITIDKELESKDDSLGYSLSADKTKAKAFYVSLKDSKIYKILHDCNAQFTIDENAMTDEINNTGKDHVELWINRWSHEITKFTTDSDTNGSKSSLVLEPKFNQKVEVKTPEKSITLKQLQNDLSGLVQSVMSASASNQSLPNDKSSVL